MISGIYPSALDCGINPDQFWEMSLLEITDIMDSYRRRVESKTKQDIMLKHFLARDIGQHIALSIHGSDEAQIAELWDFFPDLFAEEKEEAELRKQAHQLAVYKAQMQDFAYRHNHRNGGEKQ